MLQTGTNRPKHELASAKHLLENCVNLLDAKAHPELVTSAYYLLSELYLFGTIVNVDDTSEAPAAAATAADNSDDSVQEETMINTLSNAGPTGEPNVSFFHIVLRALLENKAFVVCLYGVRHSLSVIYPWYIDSLSYQGNK